MSHQSSQLTEDTEVGEEKRKGRKRESGKQGNRAGKMLEVTQKAKRRSRISTGYCTIGERWKREEEHWTLSHKGCCVLKER